MRLPGRVIGARSATPDTLLVTPESVRARDRLGRVCRRLGHELPYSPSWAASMDELEELAAELGIQPDVAVAERYLALVDWRSLTGWRARIAI